VRRIHLWLILAGAGCALPPPVGTAPPAPNLQESRPPGSDPLPLGPEELEPAQEVRSNGAVLHSPLLDLRHEKFGLVIDLLLEASGGWVGQAFVEPSTSTGQGVFLPREKWIWDGPEHRFLARLTRGEIEALDLRRTSIDQVARLVEGDPVPLERDPFENREVERFSGEVTRVEENDSGRFFFFELRDPENHYRRVFVAPSDAVSTVPTQGLAVEVEAVQTRDERGALWIAAALTIGEQRIELRNAVGRVPWPGFLGRLQGRWLHARSLLGAQVMTADGHELQVRDLWLIGECERAFYVVLRADEGSDCPVPWTTFSWTAEGPLQTNWPLEAVLAQERAEISEECVPLVGERLAPRD
jgi:hypothetical protein